ncbi:MAG: flavodoxin-dependent (E)-4-hydroxy-3-methylbut-2-enyl-diphosphate synthase [Candidatus Wallbacteria bacterium]|nr:flavodoxin-dependent (E)-4-hydroxy-3-methylbut-2-enyl-diphosphate synthase [Candidatus Wallbacteria bacterium]
MRKKTAIKVGNLMLGQGHPVRVQTMLNTDPRDFRKSLAQLRMVVNRGAEIVRVTVPDQESLKVFARLLEKATCPLVADIHFNHRLAIGAIEAGAAKIRINPGNIGTEREARDVVKSALEHSVPIRIGVNSGSLPRQILSRFGHPSPEALCETVRGFVAMFEDQGFFDIVVSAKTSSAADTIRTNRLLFESIRYPLHIGVTEAGPLLPGIVKSSLALAELLTHGIGDTIRISLTAPPVDEVDTGFHLLKYLGLRNEGIELISCPTCGRTGVNLIRIVNQAYRKLPMFRKTLKLALMGCAVNGPGEAKEADLGLAFGKGEALYFEKGKVMRKVSSDKALDFIIDRVERFTGGRS